MVFNDQLESEITLSREDTEAFADQIQLWTFSAGVLLVFSAILVRDVYDHFE